MLNWLVVVESTRIVAMAYNADAETIYVRFPNGTEWWYGNCPQLVWEEFSSPSVSKGRYIAHFLNGRPNGRWLG